MTKKDPKYPKIFFDNKRIRELRIVAQKNFQHDEVTAFYLVRPWSIYVSILLKKYTGISANTITFVMMTLSFAFPFILYSISNLIYFFIIAPILFYVNYSLDMIDGEVARLRNETSKVGEFYDSSLWFTLPAFFVTYVFKVCQFLDISYLIVIASLMTVSLEIFILVSQSLFSTNRSILNFLNNDNSIRGRIILFFKFFLNKQNFYVLFPIYYLLIDCHQTFFSLLYIVFLLIIYNLYSFIKFSKVVNSIRA